MGYQLTGLTEEEFDEIAFIGFSVCCVSGILATFLILVTLSNAKRREFPSNLSVFFGIGTLSNSFIGVIGYVYGPDKFKMEDDYNVDGQADETACILAGFIGQFFITSIILWWCCISINLYLTIVKELPMTTGFRYHMVVWPVATVSALVPLSLDGFGDAGFYCWIRETSLQLACYYVTFWVSVLVALYCWIATIMKVHRISTSRNTLFADAKKSPHSLSNTGSSSASSKHDSMGSLAAGSDYSPFRKYFRHLAFVIVFILFDMFSLTNRLLIEYTSGSNYVLWLLHTASVAFYGTFYFLIFGLPLNVTPLSLSCSSYQTLWEMQPDGNGNLGGPLWPLPERGGGRGDVPMVQPRCGVQCGGRGGAAQPRVDAGQL